MRLQQSYDDLIAWKFTRDRYISQFFPIVYPIPFNLYDIYYRLLYNIVPNYSALQLFHTTLILLIISFLFCYI